MKLAAQSIVDADREKPVAEQKYADITTVTDANYFPIVSAERLGTEQTAQFQSDDQTGAAWHWGSKCTAAGTCDSEATPANNELAEMPRGYNSVDGHGGYFNWYSATAETGKYSTVSGNASDSVCPRGWALPFGSGGNTYGQNGPNKSWYNLIRNVYELDNGVASVTFLQSAPLNMDKNMYHNNSTGRKGTISVFNLWSSGARNVYTVSSLATREDGRLYTNNDGHKADGFGVRCVLK